MVTLRIFEYCPFYFFFERISMKCINVCDPAFTLPDASLKASSPGFCGSGISYRRVWVILQGFSKIYLWNIPCFIVTV